MAKNYGNEYMDVSQDQIDIQFQDDNFQSKNFEPSFYLRLFFSYLYFTQGLILSLSATMPYIYPELPSYDVMAVFSAATLPFSFKFMFAPLIEKYTIFKYGKRKFWIVISQVLTSICLFISAFLTEFSQNYKMAVILFASVFFITLQDISLDSLANKQLRHAHITSSISVTNQLTGVIFGSMILLKMTSLQFANQIGLTEPISKTSTIVFVLSLLVFIPSVLIHFFLKQTRLKREYESIQNPLSETFCAYKAFFKWKSKYFRTIVFLIVMNQGFNFFNAGYDYEMVQAGFSRNTSNTIQNIIAIPVNVVACFLTSRIQAFGIKKGLMVGILCQILICCYLRIVFPMDVPRYSIIMFISGLFTMWTYMISTIFSYDLPLHRYTGMFITVIASFNNLGNSVTLQMKVLAWSNWWVMSWVGIGIQFLIAVFIYFVLFEWKENGVTDLDQALEDSVSDMSSQNQKEGDTKQFEEKMKKQLCQ